MGFAGVSAVKNLPAVQETQVQSLGQEDPQEEGVAAHSSILPWRIPMDRGAWRARVHGIADSRAGLKRPCMHTHLGLYPPVQLTLF